MSIEPRAVTQAFAECGVRPGDVLMLHSDALAAAQLATGTIEERMDALIEGVLAVLGETGTLVMPTFTYSATRDEPFDPENSPSTVGQITEHFRRRPGVLRSRHPIFSIAAVGTWAIQFADSDIHDCFGPGTAFGLLARHDAWLACLGCAFDRLTFVHHVEQMAAVDYRYFKAFRYELIVKGVVETGTMRYFVRDIERNTATRLDRLKAALIENGALKTGAIGRAQLLCVRVSDFTATALTLLKTHSMALIEAGQTTEPT